MTKIQYIEGDIFKSDAKILIHGCNDQGGWGSGFVIPLMKYHPEAREVYLKTHREVGLSGGQIIPVKSNGKVIINMVTQNFYGKDGKRYAKYDWIADGFFQVNALAKKYKWSKISMPLIGAGLGGGKWNVISSIIENECLDTQPIVYYLEGQKPSI